MKPPINSLNTEYLFFKEIKNIDIPKEKPMLKNAFSITDNISKDMYIIYKDTSNNIGVHNMDTNIEDKHLDLIVLLLSFMISNKEKLQFNQIKDIFNTYVLRYVLNDCELVDLERFINDGKY